MRFENLEVMPSILKALKEKKYKTPTEIQEKAIPQILKRRDIMGCAQTGTGKTAAFSIPQIQLIQKIEGRRKGKATLRSLIITPTRELALQIGENIKTYSKYTQVKHTVIYGGVKQGGQVQALKRGVHILVATPGRLLDLINQGFISLDTIKLLTLDEADQMLDMGFIHDIKKILKLIPKKRQTLFFSATMPDNILELSREILYKPVKIYVNPVSSAAETVDHQKYYTNRSDKKQLLLHILKDQSMQQVLLFARTKRGADNISRFLSKNKINAMAIHGDKAQGTRQKTLKKFKDQKLRVLVATDIAARGIDIKELNYVINFDLPNVPETYVHRIGRTGRAGKEGLAISLCEPEENQFMKDIEKLINQKADAIKDHPFPQTEKPMSFSEKKEWNKQKQKRRQAFFANRKKSRAKSRA